VLDLRPGTRGTPRCLMCRSSSAWSLASTSLTSLVVGDAEDFSACKKRRQARWIAIGGANFASTGIGRGGRGNRRSDFFVQECMTALVDNSSEKGPCTLDADARRTIIAEWILEDWIGERHAAPVQWRVQPIRMRHRMGSMRFQHRRPPRACQGPNNHAVTLNSPPLFPLWSVCPARLPKPGPRRNHDREKTDSRASCRSAH
jgi:hypothetical protein